MTRRPRMRQAGLPPATLADGRLHRPRFAAAAYRGSAGFTLIEVLVAIVVFAISIVGLVAIEARSVEAQRSSAMLRDGERVAQETMADLLSRGFVDLLTADFAGGVSALPYDDSAVAANDRLRDFRRPPTDQKAGTDIVGSVPRTFLVYRSVDMVVDPLNVPANNPPVIPTDLPQVNALVLEVTVLWIDDSNPTMPPPETLTVTGLTPEMADPTNPAYAPYVGSVTLRTVRANDTVVP